MKLSDINPFLRYAELQLSILSSAPLSCAYDFRIFYVISNKTHLVLKDERLSLSAGDLVFLRPGTPYYFEEKVQTIVLNFDLTRAHSNIKEPRRPSHLDAFDYGSIIENDAPEELCETIHIKRAFSLEPILRECIFHYSFSGELSDAFTSSALKKLICMIAERARGTDDDYLQSAEMLSKNVMMYLKNNYYKPHLSADIISSEFGYHPYYLNKVFRDNMGITIHKALINERIEAAKKLLSTTNLSVEDVALETGFGDRSQFCTAFKRLMGITPLQYRRDFCE